jgi:hypothetical protein
VKALEARKTHLWAVKDHWCHHHRRLHLECGTKGAQPDDAKAIDITGFEPVVPDRKNPAFINDGSYEGSIAEKGKTFQKQMFSFALQNLQHLKEVFVFNVFFCQLPL